jgi:hypothetical protein
MPVFQRIKTVPRRRAFVKLLKCEAATKAMRKRYPENRVINAIHRTYSAGMRYPIVRITRPARYIMDRMGIVSRFTTQSIVIADQDTGEGRRTFRKKRVEARKTTTFTPKDRSEARRKV